MNIQRANPADLRDAITVAQTLIKEGILFLPVPIFTKEQAEAAAKLADQHFKSVE